MGEQSTFLNFSAAAVLEVLHSIIISLVSADIDLQVIVAPCGRALHHSVHMSYECEQIWEYVLGYACRAVNLDHTSECVKGPAHARQSLECPGPLEEAAPNLINVAQAWFQLQPQNVFIISSLHEAAQI